MSNVVDLEALTAASAHVPAELRALKTWLVWRLVQMPGEKKARKIPYYTNGKVREGEQNEGEPFVSFERACAAVVKGSYSGVGLAMFDSNGVVAIDFDDCVVDGSIKPEVAALCQGTYSEISPSGKGVRAFFRGSVRDRKDLSHATLKVEFFCGAGYVTVTGQPTPDCEMWGYTSVTPMTQAIIDLYTERFGDPASKSQDDDDSWLFHIGGKIGLTIDKAKALVEAIDSDCGYDEWLKAGQALHHEFDGSDEALDLWDQWSRKSEEKYPGERSMRGKWESFGSYRGAPITAAWLLKHSKVARVSARYEAVADWKTKLIEVKDDYDLREQVCPAIGRDDRLDHVDREALAQLIVKRFKALGLVLPIGTIRTLIAPPESLVPTVKSRRPLTEFGNAERMVDRFGDALMYVPELDTWHTWTGVYWKRATSTEIEQFAVQTIRGLVTEADQHQDQGEFFAFAAISQQARMVRSMVNLVSSDPRILVNASDVDSNPNVLGTRNGSVDLTSSKLFAPDPAIRITKVTSCDYKPDAKCPLFERTVREVFCDDDEMAAFFQRLIGYILLGQPHEDIMVIAYGTGSNGKSTLFGTIRRVLGGYARTADPSSFIEGKGGANAGGPREDLVRLRGARMVYVNEPDEGGELREGMVKSMTGGDMIAARGMFARETIEIEPSWVVVMPTNHKPIIKGSDNGIWRRLMLLPFLRNFKNDPDIEIDVAREEKLKAEAEGVLAWCVQGARAYLQSGLRPPQTVAKAIDQYRSQMDLLAEWVEDRCECDPSYSEESQQLWLSWQAYAAEHGILQYIRSSVALGRRLDQRFPSAKGSRGVRIRMGIRLKKSNLYADDFFET